MTEQASDNFCAVATAAANFLIRKCNSLPELMSKQLAKKVYAQNKEFFKSCSSEYDDGGIRMGNKTGDQKEIWYNFLKVELLCSCNNW